MAHTYSHLYDIRAMGVTFLYI